MITMHHHIEDIKNNTHRWFHFQSMKSFEAQMKMLRSNAHKKNEFLDFCVTFDDGLKSQLNVLKILDRYEIKASFYYNTATLRDEFVANVHLVHILLKLLTFGQKQQLLEDLGNCIVSAKSHLDAKYIYRKQGDYTIDQKLKFLVNYQRLSPEGDAILREALLRTHTHTLKEINHQIYMDQSELQLIFSLGHEVLPHGHTHKILGLMSKSELREELNAMLDVHNQLFSTDFYDLCVPFGSKYSWSRECEAVSEDLGLKRIILVDPVKNILPDPSHQFEYVSRTDCCLLDNYEYVLNEN